MMPAQETNAVFDPNIICPLTGEPLCRAGDTLTSSTSRYTISDGIPLLYVDEPGQEAQAGSQAGVTHGVQDFYSDAPFPNYNDFDDIHTFMRAADAGIFARLLREQIPAYANVLEIGCGTAQLSNYLAATTLSRIYAADMTAASLRLGHAFASRNAIESITFVQTNLFMPAFRPESMDMVIANGVLHHTYDTQTAFMRISRLVKPGGYVIVGLYNHIGRLRTDIRRLMVKCFGEGALYLDPHLRKHLSPEKRRAWIKDQYYHPQERKHSMSQMMQWFDEAGFTFISSIPKIHGEFRHDENLFAPQDPGTHSDRLLAEISMLFSQYGSEGGLFICIGQKKA